MNRAGFQESASAAGLTWRMHFLPNEQGETFKINLYDHGAGVAVGSGALAPGKTSAPCRSSRVSDLGAALGRSTISLRLSLPELFRITRASKFASAMDLT